MPGNHESENDITAFCARHGFVDFHGAKLELGGLRFAGLGYSTPTPFDTPGEYSEAEMAARLEKFAEWKPQVLICHAPPLDTALSGSRKACTPEAAPFVRLSRSISPHTFSAVTFTRPKAQ